jgi:hypothetical protein
MTFDSKRDMNTAPCYAHVNFYANEKHIMSICADNQAEVDEIIKSAEAETAFSTDINRSKNIIACYRVKGTPFYYASSPEKAEEYRARREKIHGLQSEIDFENMVKNGQFQY